MATLEVTNNRPTGAVSPGPEGHSGECPKHLSSSFPGASCATAEVDDDPGVKGPTQGVLVRRAQGTSGQVGAQHPVPQFSHILSQAQLQASALREVFLLCSSHQCVLGHGARGLGSHTGQRHLSLGWGARA